jgi:4-amino-4-deoxy-L-arabinose transferase-like glycosyltransferase
MTDDPRDLPCSKRRRHCSIQVLAVLVLAVGLRTGGLLLAGEMPTIGDEGEYLRMASSLAYEGDISKGSLFSRPPLHPAVLAVGLKIAPWEDAHVARAVVSLLGCAVVFAVWALARAVAGPTAGLLAALVMAVHPLFVAYSHWLWSETLFALLLVLLLLALQRWESQRHRRLLILAGVLFALAVETRSMLLGFGVLILAWIGLAERFRVRPWVRHGLVFALPALAIILGYGAVLSAKLRMVKVMPGRTGYNLLIGNGPWTNTIVGNKPHVLSSIRSSGLRFLERDRFARDLAVQYIKRDPMRPLRDALGRRKIGGLWAPNQWLVRRLERGEYGGATKGWAEPVEAVVVAMHWTVILLGAVGFALAPSKRYLILHVALLLYASLVALVFFGTTRFHVPFLPLFVIYGSLAVTRAAAGARSFRQALMARAKKMTAR